MPILLTLKDIDVSFGEQKVLRKFSLQICQNDFISILGKSGSGKTTILNLIAGEVDYQGGEIIKENDNNFSHSIVFQEYNKSLFPWMTVVENMKLVNNSSKVDATCYQYLEMVGLLEHKKKYPWQLSGGMQQRLAIARALMLNPKLLLMDEPFGSLDYSIRNELEDILKKLRELMSITIVCVTHDIESALYLSNTICLIDSNLSGNKIISIEENSFLDRKSIYTSETYSRIYQYLNV